MAKESKPLAVIALGEAVKKQTEGKKTTDPETDPGLLAAVDDLAAAFGVEVKDREGAAAALEDFVRICRAKDYEGDAVDDEE